MDPGRMDPGGINPYATPLAADAPPGSDQVDIHATLLATTRMMRRHAWMCTVFVGNAIILLILESTGQGHLSWAITLLVGVTFALFGTWGFMSFVRPRWAGEIMLFGYHDPDGNAWTPEQFRRLFGPGRIRHRDLNRRMALPPG